MQDVIVKVISSHTFTFGSPAPAPFYKIFTQRCRYGTGKSKMKMKKKRRRQSKKFVGETVRTVRVHCDDGWTMMTMMMMDTHSVTAPGLYLLVCSQAASACTETFLPDTQRQLTVKGNKARQTLRCDVSAS